MGGDGAPPITLLLCCFCLTPFFLPTPTPLLHPTCSTAIVVFQLFLHFSLGMTYSAGDIILFLLRVSLGG